tara:strand:+ start:5911 stop:6642 length:732 start_codon:yes stop_codon:yes gene_type:complete
MARGVKKKDYERLEDSNISNVIKLLGADEPITKKEACEILNIRYNTTRLQRIIDEYNEVWEYKEKRKSQNRGKGATRDEIKTIIEYYLDGDNISEIATRTYRSNAFVKAILERVGVPEKLTKEAHSKVYKHKYQMLPEECVRDKFEDGELVWSVRDNGIAKILRELTTEYQNSMPGYIKPVTHYEHKYGSRGYSIWAYDPVPQHVMEKTYFPYLDGSKVGRYSFSLAYDLGSLKHLEKYGVIL